MQIGANRGTTGKQSETRAIVTAIPLHGARTGSGGSAVCHGRDETGHPQRAPSLAAARRRRISSIWGSTCFSRHSGQMLWLNVAPEWSLM